MLQKVLDSSAFLKVKCPIVRLPILLYQTIIRQAGDYTIQKLMARLYKSKKKTKLDRPLSGPPLIVRPPLGSTLFRMFFDVSIRHRVRLQSKICRTIVMKIRTSSFV